MTMHALSVGPVHRSVSVLLAMALATAPSASVIAQTNAAQQAVRQSVEQFGPYRSTPSEYREGYLANEYTNQTTDPNAPRIDTSFVSPTASAVLVIRPAQLLGSPSSEMLPKEVAAAAGLKYLGFDPAEVEEIVAFVEMPNPLALTYAVAIKFVNPFRAASIPVEQRDHAQLAELGGKKYLKSTLPPPMYSLYGPNSRMLVLAPEPTLQQLVQSIGQPKSGPIADRVQMAPAGSDLYLAVDGTLLQTLVPAISQVPRMLGFDSSLGSGPIEPVTGPAEPSANGEPLSTSINLVATAELTLNLSNHGPMSLVLHARDESAAQQLETTFNEARMKSQAAAQAAAGDDPIQQAFVQYLQRVSQPTVPQRNGTSLTCFYLDSQHPAQKQLITSIVNLAFAVGIPAAQAAAQQAQDMGQADGAPLGAEEEAPFPIDVPESH